MYKECKILQSKERQREFELALFRLLSKKEYKNITVTALCKEINAPRKAFYRYFDTIDDVLIASFHEIFQGAFVYIEECDIEKFFVHWKNHKPILDVLEKRGLSQRLVDTSLSLFIEAEKIEDLTDLEMKKMSGIATLFTLVIMWHHSGMTKSVEEMKILAVEILGSNICKK